MMEYGILSLIDAAGSVDRMAHVATTYADNYVFSGKFFSVEHVLAVGSGDTTYDIILDTTDVTRLLVAQPPVWMTTAGPVIITRGLCTSYTGGTEVPATNRHYAYQSTYTAQTVVKYDVSPTGYSAGNMQLLIGTASTNQNSGGGSYVGTAPMVFAPGVKHVLRVSNNAGAAISLFCGLSWQEL